VLFILGIHLRPAVFSIAVYGIICAAIVAFTVRFSSPATILLLTSSQVPYFMAFRETLLGLPPDVQFEPSIQPAILWLFVDCWRFATAVLAMVRRFLVREPFLIVVTASPHWSPHSARWSLLCPQSDLLRLPGMPVVDFCHVLLMCLPR
jgi:hypothetical protein